MKAILLLVVFIAGCGDWYAESCRHESAAVEAYEACEAGPKCVMSPEDYSQKKRAQRAVARFCKRSPE